MGAGAPQKVPQTSEFKFQAPAPTGISKLWTPSTYDQFYKEAAIPKLQMFLRSWAALGALLHPRLSLVFARGGVGEGLKEPLGLVRANSRNYNLGTLEAFEKFVVAKLFDDCCLLLSEGS